MQVSREQRLERAKERFALQDYHGAILLVEELTANGRAFADAHHLLGISYYMLGQKERALESLDAALALNPRYVEALIHRGIILGELGRDADAQAAFQKAHETGSTARRGLPQADAAQIANQHAALGQAYAEIGALDRAIDQYRQALELGPGFEDLRYRLGRLLLDAGRALEAREVLTHVVAARPHSPDPKATLGLACYLSGDPDAARAVWETLRREHPADPRADAYLAMLARAAENA